jgi:hypothetical protein
MAHEGVLRKGSPLEVTLKTDRDCYRLGDEIEIQILLINRSESPLYIYAMLDWGESSSFSVWLKDARSGKHLEPRFWGAPPPPPPASKEAFVPLEPLGVYGRVFLLKLADLGVQNRGQYEIVAEYHSPISSSESFGLPIWSREKGAVPANRVTISVGD